MNWKEQFDKEFVRVTSPSTIGSGRSEMVEPMVILNVRKPEKIKQFISTKVIENLLEDIEKEEIIDDIEFDKSVLIAEIPPELMKEAEDWKKIWNIALKHTQQQLRDKWL